MKRFLMIHLTDHKKDHNQNNELYQLSRRVDNVLAETRVDYLKIKHQRIGEIE